MKLSIKLLLSAIVSCFIFSQCMLDECSSKSRFVQNYNTFIDDVSENYKEFSDSEWEKNDKKLEHFIDECYEKHEEDLSSDEKKEIWAKSLKYYYKRHGIELYKLIESESKELSETFKEEIEKLKNYSAEDFEKIFKEVFKEDLSDFIDNALESLEDFGEKLKKELNDSDK